MTRQIDRDIALVSNALAEIDKIYSLLKRWQSQSKYLFDCHEPGKVWRSAELESIIKRTDEVLEGEER